MGPEGTVHVSTPLNFSKMQSKSEGPSDFQGRTSNSQHADPLATAQRAFGPHSVLVTPCGGFETREGEYMQGSRGSTRTRALEWKLRIDGNAYIFGRGWG
jgi:hypothetical protein